MDRFLGTTSITLGMAGKAAKSFSESLDLQRPSTGASAAAEMLPGAGSTKSDRLSVPTGKEAASLPESVDSLTGINPDAAPESWEIGLGAVDTVTGVGAGFFGESSLEVFTYIVTLDTAGLPLAERAREVLGVVRPEALFSNLGMLTARLTAAQAQALARRPGVVGVELDQIVTLTLPGQREVNAVNRKPGGGGTTTPAPEILDWGVKHVWGNFDPRTNPLRVYTRRVFVLDTGISGATGDLNFNTVESLDFTASSSGVYDRNGHGTHVAGTIAAYANNRGVVGVAPGAEVISYKVLNDRGSGSYSGMIAAINSLIANARPGDVVNMSLSGSLSAALNDAIRAAADKGILFSIAAGNDSKDVDSVSPASAGNVSKGIFTISAHGASLRNASFTNFDNFGGSDLDNVAYAAPGVNIVSLKIDGTTTALSGTSMAAPHVAGLLAQAGLNAFLANTSLANKYGFETTDPLAIWSGFMD